ncbi:unnamed protein product [Urochloa humidicola]
MQLQPRQHGTHLRPGLPHRPGRRRGGRATSFYFLALNIEPVVMEGLFQETTSQLLLKAWTAAFLGGGGAPLRVGPCVFCFSVISPLQAPADSPSLSLWC